MIAFANKNMHKPSIHNMLRRIASKTERENPYAIAYAYGTVGRMTKVAGGVIACTEQYPIHNVFVGGVVV